MVTENLWKHAIWSVVLFDGSDEGVLKSESLIVLQPQLQLS